MSVDVPDTAHPGKKGFGLSSIMPFVALALSLYSLYESGNTRKEVARMEDIKTEYGLFHELADLQVAHPDMSHLFAVTNQMYDEDAAQVGLSIGSPVDTERAKMLLLEHAVAHRLFTTYEEAYYIWRHAADGDDKRREEQANDDLAYFNVALCGNPRLLWYWDGKGGRFEGVFAEDLRAYYKEHVLQNCQTAQDSLGPFGIHARSGK